MPDDQAELARLKREIERARVVVRNNEKAYAHNRDLIEFYERYGPSAYGMNEGAQRWGGLAVFVGGIFVLLMSGGGRSPAIGPLSSFGWLLLGGGGLALFVAWLFALSARAEAKAQYEKAIAVNASILANNAANVAEVNRAVDAHNAVVDRIEAPAREAERRRQQAEEDRRRREEAQRQAEAKEREARRAAEAFERELLAAWRLYLADADFDGTRDRARLATQFMAQYRTSAAMTTAKAQGALAFVTDKDAVQLIQSAGAL